MWGVINQHAPEPCECDVYGELIPTAKAPLREMQGQ